jgi:hypothetical protein
LAGALITLNVADALFALPAVFETTQRNVASLSPATVGGVV